MSNETKKAALKHLAAYRTVHPYGDCPLSELYAAVASEMTIGQYHDMIREMVAAQLVKLHPFTGAAYQMEQEQYAMVSGQEIKYYASRKSN